MTPDIDKFARFHHDAAIRAANAGKEKEKDNERGHLIGNLAYNVEQIIRDRAELNRAGAYKNNEEKEEYLKMIQWYASFFKQNGLRPTLTTAELLGKEDVRQLQELQAKQTGLEGKVQPQGA